MRTEAARPQRGLPRLLWVLAVAALAARLLAPDVRDRMAWVPAAEAAALASSSGRPILYYFGAEWCAPCKLLERDVFANPYEAAGLAKRFVPVRVQDRQREDGANPPEVEALEARYDVESFPTLVVAHPDGTEAGRVVGYRDRRAVHRLLATSTAASAARR